MSTLVISRTRGSVVDRFRPYEVLIDGVSRGRVSVNERLSITIEPGAHTVRFRMDFYGSLPVMVHVTDGETSVVCRSSTRRLFGLLALFTPESWIMTSVIEYSHLPRPLPQPRAAMRKRPSELGVSGPHLPKAFLNRYRLAR